MTGALGISQTREGSGTSWLPDASPMHAVHSEAGDWELMLHGNAFVQFIHQGGTRGDDQFGSINWLMGMARRSVAGGELGLRLMVSAEPFTIPGCGYPILLATGELCDGEPIHDAQHPHDLFMELAGTYQRAITEGVAFQLYGGPVGEPALGPVAFPHRISALPNPLAPISHHWFDATHIAFGVATAGLYGRQWKVEGSLFNGREPDEERLGIDLAPLDSYAGRLWWLPSERWAIQLSAGRLHEAEPGHSADDPRVDVTRYTTSATYHQPLTGGGILATTAALGRNLEDGEGTNALLVESNLSLGERHLFFGRAEWTEKAGHDLDLEPHELEEQVYDVGTITLGYARQFAPYGSWVPGIGARASVNFLPETLEPFYGKRNPTGFTIFASLRPAPMAMGMDMDMAHPVAPVPVAPAPLHGGHEGVTQGETPAAPSVDHAAMGHATPGDSAGGTGLAGDARLRLMEEMHMRMMADPVIRERVATDPVLQRMMAEMGTTTPAGHSTEHAGAVPGSADERALDFIVRLLSDPEVEARIHSDPRLHQLWSDPEVQRRLAELRRQRTPDHEHAPAPAQEHGHR